MEIKKYTELEHKSVLTEVIHVQCHCCPNTVKLNKGHVVDHMGAPICNDHKLNGKLKITNYNYKEETKMEPMKTNEAAMQKVQPADTEASASDLTKLEFQLDELHNTIDRLNKELILMDESLELPNKDMVESNMENRKFSGRISKLTNDTIDKCGRLEEMIILTRKISSVLAKPGNTTLPSANYPIGR